MKRFQNVKKGYEVEFLNSENKLETALVNYVDDKKFTIEVIRYSNFKKEWYSLQFSWFLSGKKTSRFHNYGNAYRIVNKINK